ncbi:MAG: DNA gyrase subunit A [Candidatus Caenarcaniphilales bacterium]|nr:DNA gyrase subunit A [Candidatus Caenarcaniphilales bacterium]
MSSDNSSDNPTTPNTPKNTLRVVQTDINDEMRSSFIDYAMSIIVSRALPDVRDGLKPVHRRILFAMSEIGLSPDKPYKKCARIVGEVLGKYHPHGDTAVYDALVRLAQPFSSRYPLTAGHGNFGSLDDNPAAMRYTEARLSKVAVDVLADIDSETVDFQDNFDGSLKEPIVLPSKLPVLLLNGSSGIAVGMATNIPPHNLGEVIDGLVHLIENPEASIRDLMQFIKGPDFPSGGMIMGMKGIEDAFHTGRGSVPVRALTEIEEIGGKVKNPAIIVKELPYLVGPESLIQKIADLVKNERITGIADLNDESGRQGTRVVIKLKRDANPDVVLNNLFKFTPLQQNFPVNTLALVNGRPQLLDLKSLLHHFIEHRVEVVTRKAKYDLRKANERSHIVIGLLKALSMLDKVIALIKGSNSTDEAKKALMRECDLSERQSEAILEMQLRRLTGLEQDKLQKEHLSLLERIAELEKLLSSREFILENIKADLIEMKAKHNNPRMTQILPSDGEFTTEDLIPNETMMIFLTSQDYIKRIPTEVFESQNRAGRGKGGIATREEDDLQHCLTARMHDELLFFTNRGVVYSEKVYQIPEGTRQTKGKAVINIVPLIPGETITAVIPISKDIDVNQTLIMLTKLGTIKKINLGSFTNIRRSGIIALNLSDGDELCWVKMAKPESHIVLATHQGMVIRYAESELRPLGRTAAGVKAINLRKGDKLISCATFDPKQEDDTYLLLVTDDGYGKRVHTSEFRDQKRGGTGLIGTKFKKDVSKLAGICVVKDDNEVIIATANGVILRQKSSDIPTQSRMATGVRLQQVDDKDRVVSINPINAEVEQSSTLVAGEDNQLEEIVDND